MQPLQTFGVECVAILLRSPLPRQRQRLLSCDQPSVRLLRRYSRIARTPSRQDGLSAMSRTVFLRRQPSFRPLPLHRRWWRAGAVPITRRLHRRRHLGFIALRARRPRKSAAHAFWHTWKHWTGPGPSDLKGRSYRDPDLRDRPAPSRPVRCRGAAAGRENDGPQFPDLSIGIQYWVLPHFACCRCGVMRRAGREPAGAESRPGHTSSA